MKKITSFRVNRKISGARVRPQLKFKTLKHLRTTQEASMAMMCRVVCFMMVLGFCFIF